MELLSLFFSQGSHPHALQPFLGWGLLFQAGQGITEV